MHSPLFQKLAKQYKNGAGLSTPPSPELQKVKRVRKRPSSSSPCYEVSFVCSYGGTLMLRSDGKLKYVGGAWGKLVQIRYDSTFSDLTKLMSEKFKDGLFFHYNYMSERLEALVPVTDDKSFQDMLDDIKLKTWPKTTTMRAILLPSPTVEANIVGSIDEGPAVLQRRFYFTYMVSEKIPIHPSCLDLIDELYPSPQEMESKDELHPNSEDNATESMVEG